MSVETAEFDDVERGEGDDEDEDGGDRDHGETPGGCVRALAKARRRRKRRGLVMACSLRTVLKERGSFTCR
jgi:hypothetical protein